MGLKIWHGQAISPNEGRRRRAMKLVSVQLALLSAVAAIAFAAAGRAQDAATVTPQQVQAKLAYCEVCHGPSARGFVGYYPIPRLAGQQIAYIKNQLQGFIERKRSNPIMINISHVLSPAMLTALATNFHDLNPKPLGGAPRTFVDAGEKIYEQGLPDANVPPCAACHGPDAKGNEQFPRLAGQLYPYVVGQLTNWSKERGEDLSNIMAPIAHTLTKQQIEAVAAYVSYLE
ncbi:MAG: c-type cytochrome [Xanthobacteraceae bacterium]